jgi:hypothetical protein
MSFVLNGYQFPFFISGINCGYPPARMTERSVELSIANVFLDTVPRDKVLEIGAVTPYYWPYRVLDVCDPVDPHRQVNIRASMLDIKLTGRIVLSISTFEHIGKADYGLERDVQLNVRAFQKLFAECECFLITVPGGYFPEMDKYLTSLDPPEIKCSISYLIRGREDNNWSQVHAPQANTLTYGHWADSLIILSRNTFFERTS